MSEEAERPVAVHLLDRTSGERSVYPTTGWWEGRHFQPYIWEEGNYSCDCNRVLFFLRGRGEPEPDHASLTCSDGRFAVERIVDLTTGETVYSED